MHTIARMKSNVYRLRTNDIVVEQQVTGVRALSFSSEEASGDDDEAGNINTGVSAHYTQIVPPTAASFWKIMDMKKKTVDTSSLIDAVPQPPEKLVVESAGYQQSGRVLEPACRWREVTNSPVSNLRRMGLTLARGVIESVVGHEPWGTWSVGIVFTARLEETRMSI